MTVHWHDDDRAWCPCDEPEGAVAPSGASEPDDGPTFEVDYDERADQWIGHCSEHGEIFRHGGDHPDHNAVVIGLARHDESQHDGDGMVHWQMWSI